MDSTSSSSEHDLAARRASGTSDRLLRVGEVADALGVSVRQVWKLTADASLPSPVKVGKATRWRASEIQQWIRGGGLGSVE